MMKLRLLPSCIGTFVQQRFLNFLFPKGVVGLLCVVAHNAYALEPLNDGEMEAVTGQRGILLSFQYYFNSHPDQAGAANTGTGGCSAPNGGTSLADTDCRFAVQITSRESEWLVFKNGHASIDVDKLAIDASVLGGSRGADAAYAGWFDAAKFQDIDGVTCLLEAGCTTTAISQMAGLRLSYPEGTNGENFGNVKFGMYFEGLAVEPNLGAPNGNGWVGNQNGSFMGLNVADNNGQQANIAFGGDFYLYGF